MLGDVSISKDDRIDVSILKKYEHSSRIKMLEVFSGEYFCKMDVLNTELRSFNLIVFGSQKLNIESIDSEMGRCAGI